MPVYILQEATGVEWDNHSCQTDHKDRVVPVQEDKVLLLLDNFDLEGISIGIEDGGGVARWEEVPSWKNYHLIGWLADQKGADLYKGKYLPDAQLSSKMDPDQSRIVLSGVEDQYEKHGVCWARKGRLELVFEDGAELSFDLEGALLFGENHEGYSPDMLAIGPDPVSIIDDQAGYGFQYRDDGDTWDTQEHDYTQEINDLLDELTQCQPLLEKLNQLDAPFRQTSQLHSIELIREGKDIKAIVTFVDGTRSDPVRVR
jgi:hypothetical protein